MGVSAHESSRLRLLVVENARHIIDELRDAFAGGRSECEVALDIQTARAILAERRMDAIIVDARTVSAGRSRISDLIKQFKALDASMKIVIFNGGTSTLTQRRLRRLGADGYLSRKSDLKAVERSVRRVLGQEL